jgi:hypothetical protein
MSIGMANSAPAMTDRSPTLVPAAPPVKATGEALGVPVGTGATGAAVTVAKVHVEHFAVGTGATGTAVHVGHVGMAV